jgi:hypothetical protein
MSGSTNACLLGELILGSGQMGNVHLSPEAEAYFAKKRCKVVLQSTPEAIHVFNRSHAKKIGLFHVTGGTQPKHGLMPAASLPKFLPSGEILFDGCPLAFGTLREFAPAERTSPSGRGLVNVVSDGRAVDAARKSAGAFKR